MPFPAPEKDHRKTELVAKPEKNYRAPVLPVGQTRIGWRYFMCVDARTIKLLFPGKHVYPARATGLRWSKSPFQILLPTFLHRLLFLAVDFRGYRTLKKKNPSTLHLNLPPRNFSGVTN
jgi:hypothetical protein